MNFKQEFIEMFKDDYIKIGKYVLKPFSLGWWLMCLVQGAIGAVCLWGFYMLMWLAIG